MSPSTNDPPLPHIGGVIAWGLGIVAVQASLWLAWMLIAAGCEPSLRLMLAETDALLSAILRLFITLCMATCAYYYLLVVIAFPLAMVELFLIVSASQSRNRWLDVARSAAVIFFSVGPLLLVLFGVLSLLGISTMLARDLTP